MEHLQINIRKTNNWGISGFPKKKKELFQKTYRKICEEEAN